MILIYQWEEDLMELKLYSCAPNLDIPVDHLHFELRVCYKKYKEEFEGLVPVDNSDDSASLSEKVSRVYLQELVKLRDTKYALH